MKRVPALACRALLLLLLVQYLACAWALPLICLPIRAFSRRASTYVASFFAFWAWSLFAGIFRLTTSVSFPPRLRRHESYLVVSNHIGSVDFMVMNEIAIAYGMLSTLKYLIKDTAIYIPVFGIGMKMAGFLYLRRNLDEDRRRIVEYCRFVREAALPLWLIVYPEGTRFTASKRARSQEFSRRRGLPVLNNVLLPKTGGFRLLLENFRNSQIKNVADITVFFDSPAGRVPTLLELVLGRVSGAFRVSIEVTPIAEIQDADRFLIDSFVRKDQIIEAWRSEAQHKHTSKHN